LERSLVLFQWNKALVCNHARLSGSYHKVGVIRERELSGGIAELECSQQNSPDSLNLLDSKVFTGATVSATTKGNEGEGLLVVLSSLEAVRVIGIGVGEDIREAHGKGYNNISCGIKRGGSVPGDTAIKSPAGISRSLYWMGCITFLIKQMRGGNMRRAS
jgi:hypothetical protein